MLREQPDFTALVTENPVESGTKITDHVVLQPITLQIVGILTDTPNNFLGSLVTGAGGLTATALGAADVIAGLTAAATGALLGEIRPGLAMDKFRLLVALQSTREPFDVVTGFTTYHNMVFESLSAPRAPEHGRSIRFTATLREILIVGTTEKSNRQTIVEEIWPMLATKYNGVVGKALKNLNPLL